MNGFILYQTCYGGQFVTGTVVDGAFSYAPLLDPQSSSQASAKALADWWEQQRVAQGRDDTPCWGKIDKLDLAPWMGWLCVYEAVGGGKQIEDARFRLVGTHIVEAAGYDLTGVLLSERSYSLTPQIVIGNLNRIAAHGRPALQNNKIQTLGGYAEVSDRLWVPFQDQAGEKRIIMLFYADVTVLVDQFEPSRYEKQFGHSNGS